jgi:hypothetical protein
VEDFDPENVIHPYEDAEVYKEDGSLLFRVVAHAFEMGQVERAYEQLRSVKGDCTTRPEATGGNRELRPHADGSPSRQSRSSLSKVAEYKKNGCNADIFGYFDPTPQFKYCRQTAWTARDKKKGAPVFRATMPLIVVADRIFQTVLPERHAFQLYHVADAIDFSLGNTCFSTVTVNKKLSTTYHRDQNDLKGGFGVMFTLGDFEGGQLVFPAFRCAVDYRPGSMILAHVHETHGNLDNITGTRITCVLYAREHIDKCGSAEDEEKKHAGKLVVHARED